ERLDVARPPGRDEPIDQVTLGARGSRAVEPREASAVALSLESSPRPLYGAVNGRDARLQELCRLRGGPPENVAQDEDCALTRWEQLERGDEGELDVLSQLDRRLRVLDSWLRVRQQPGGEWPVWSGL